MSSRPTNKRPAALDPTLLEKSAKKKPANKKEASKELTNVTELDSDEDFGNGLNDSKDAPDKKNAAKTKEEQKNNESANDEDSDSEDLFAPVASSVNKKKEPATADDGAADDDMQTQRGKHAELTTDPATVAATSKSALAVGLRGALPKTLVWEVLLPGTDTVRES